MLNLVRRYVWRPSSYETQGDRGRQIARGPVTRMMLCDMNNLDRLARALAEPRR